MEVGRYSSDKVTSSSFQQKEEQQKKSRGDMKNETHEKRKK